MAKLNNLALITLVLLFSFGCGNSGNKSNNTANNNKRFEGTPIPNYDKGMETKAKAQDMVAAMNIATIRTALAAATNQLGAPPSVKCVANVWNGGEVYSDQDETKTIKLPKLIAEPDSIVMTENGKGYAKCGEARSKKDNTFTTKIGFTYENGTITFDAGYTDTDGKDWTTY